ncbi:MAG: LysR family transcriptional regulator [Pseudacidovorax sp.]|uniref:LysR substrate-binding domain-containing protein n=1 Tax=Pseudacidovorax sp. TaxID=1934311 RepID=UPI001B67EE04|nr:LysR substrate-binding domain-containing protein [Pseudacidovorax sp.]MBP6896646.1 LysR family transcriptional regulator [Pseudacidovorax sp.]
MSPVQDLNDLVFFAEVVERGGFSAASRALDVPKSRLSRRIAQLEASLGVQLLQRSTRRLSLTPAGEVYLRHCIAVREAAEAGAAEVAQVRKEPRGLVRLSCPVTLAQSNVGPALPEFFSRHPGVQLEMRVVNRPVDPVEEGVDVALRVRNEVENSATLASRVFGRSKLLLVGTPALLARHGPLTHPESLEQVECVAMSAADARAGTLLQGPGGATHLLMQTPRYLANDLLTLRFAVEQGVGIGFLPDYLCREAMQAGRLQSVLPDWQPPPGLVHAMFTPRRALVPAVRAVLDFLGEVLAEPPERSPLA